MKSEQVMSEFVRSAHELMVVLRKYPEFFVEETKDLRRLLLSYHVKVVEQYFARGESFELVIVSSYNSYPVHVDTVLYGIWFHGAGFTSEILSAATNALMKLAPEQQDEALKKIDERPVFHPAMEGAGEVEQAAYAVFVKTLRQSYESAKRAQAEREHA